VTFDEVAIGPGPSPVQCQGAANAGGLAVCSTIYKFSGNPTTRRSFGGTDPTLGTHGRTDAFQIPISSTSLLNAVRTYRVNGQLIEGQPTNEWTVNILTVDSSDPTWVKFGVDPLPGFENTIQGAYGVARWQSRAWKVYDLGNATVGCTTVPANIIAQLQLDCGGTTPPIQVVPPTGPSIATTPPTVTGSQPLLLVFPGGTENVDGSVSSTPVFEPSGFWFTSDSTGYVDGLTWSTWDASGAVGTGTLHVNDCNPNCATGNFASYPATVRLSGASQAQNGFIFTQMGIDSPTAPGGSQSFSIPR
jgi:hypothetical protein